MIKSPLDTLKELRDIDKLKGLEIGALATPLVVRKRLSNRGEIFYLDHLSTEALQKKYSKDKSVEVDQIVTVDYVCPDGELLKAVKGDCFDYIVSSHVIEHTPNPLKFLSDVWAMLKPGGLLFLVIPDKRFTFDVNRPITTFGVALQNFYLKKSKPDVAAVYDHFSLATRANGHNIWHGINNPEDSRVLTSSAYAWEASSRVENEDIYLDVHINVFTPQSFFDILYKAVDHGIVTYRVEKFIDTGIGQIEFIVALEKPQLDDLEKSKEICLDSIPTLELENILSPYMPQVNALSNALEQAIKINGSTQVALEMERKKSLGIEMELDKVRATLSTAESVLARRSVKFILSLVDKLFAIKGTFRK